MKNLFLIHIQQLFFFSLKKSYKNVTSNVNLIVKIKCDFMDCYCTRLHLPEYDISKWSQIVLFWCCMTKVC